MRVYEFAKQHNLASKDVLESLSSAGFSVGSHMTVLTDDALAFLEKNVNKQAAVPPVAEKAPVVEKVEKTVVRQQPSVVTARPEPVVAVAPVQPSAPEVPVVRRLIPRVAMTLGDLADKLNIPAGELIVALLRQGIVVNRNQAVTDKVLDSLSGQFHFDVEKPVRKKEPEAFVRQAAAVSSHSKERPPVVVVIGHVDHGKTTFLDFIRKTRVAVKEKGGITQHLGAYQVQTNHGGIIFLDTPGHEAFSMMRKRGVGVADIAVLMVAADDGIMPQTVEAIKQAQAANVPIVVAANKMDKADPSRLEALKKQLSQHGLIAEDWGGQTIVMPISAKTGQGVDEFLEMLALQAEIMELKADDSAVAAGYILDSKMEKGFGTVATFLAQQGMLRVGDYFVVGAATGRVMSIKDSYGKRLQLVGPAVPVQIAGFDALPQVGDYLQVVTQQEYRKAKIVGTDRVVGSQRQQQEGAAVITLLIKADTESSREALVESIHKLADQEKKNISIVVSAVGDITESDINHAETTGATIYGFGVKVDQNALQHAQESGVVIRNFHIIYQILDALKVELVAKQKKEIVKEKTGEAIIKKVFDIKKVGKIAGFHVKQGKIIRQGEVIVWRDDVKVGEGKIKSLQRDKKMMKEVGVGFEGALMVDGFEDWQEEDRIECVVESAKL